MICECSRIRQLEGAAVVDRDYIDPDCRGIYNIIIIQKIKLGERVIDCRELKV